MIASLTVKMFGTWAFKCAKYAYELASQSIALYSVVFGVSGCE